MPQIGCGGDDMCSINGVTIRDEASIRRMNAVTAHRGPDDEGVFTDDDVSLGHRRLSIIDLDRRSRQPMESRDGRLVIVYNGELYNFKELKAELSQYPYRTQSDTEVILAAFERWGPECLRRFNGIFALAIWDRKRRELLLARDHQGIKPLYYAESRGRLLFSSEIKAILECPDILRRLDTEAFNHYLRLLYVPAPLTMLKGIYKFPPAHYGVWSNGTLKFTKYWDVPSAGDRADAPTFSSEELRRRISEAVRRQLVSDRPLGVFLSGGIDSSSVLWAMTEHHRDRIDTFSVGFRLRADEQPEKFNRDLRNARTTAAFFRTNHHEIFLSSDEVVDLLSTVVWHLDEPISNPTAIARYVIAKFAKQTVDVALAGDGGDELFGGYHRYRYSMMTDAYRRWVPPLLRSPLCAAHSVFCKLNTPPGADRLLRFMGQKDGVLRRVVAPEVLDLDAARRFLQEQYFLRTAAISPTEQLMDVDRRTWLVDESLMQTDKLSMAHGLETRVPFLDRDIIEFASSVPLRRKTSFLDTKMIVKDAMRSVLPPHLFGLPKRGWFSPAAKWLRHPAVDRFAAEALSANYYGGTSGLLNWDAARDMLVRHREKQEYNLTMIWALLTFQVWARRFAVGV